MNEAYREFSGKSIRSVGLSKGKDEPLKRLLVELN